MTAPKDGYNSGITRVQLGGTNSSTGKWDESTQGGAVSLATYLTMERNDTSVATISGISQASPAVFTIPSTAYSDGDSGTVTGSDSGDSADGSWTVVKVSDIAFTLQDASGNAFNNTGAAGTTGTITFTHLARGYSQVGAPIVEMTTAQRTGLVLDGSHYGKRVWDTTLEAAGYAQPLQKWNGDGWVDAYRSTDGSQHVIDIGTVNQRHNRYLTLADGDTWPGDETYKVTFTQLENVRRYRVRFESATADSILKVVEDAANEAQAQAWLADASSSASADVEYIRLLNAGLTTATTNKDSGWSEWQELSKDQTDLSLSNLYFLGDTNEAYSIWVEAE